jgi:hypothetical protein
MVAPALMMYCEIQRIVTAAVGEGVRGDVENSHDLREREIESAAVRGELHVVIPVKGVFP